MAIVAHSDLAKIKVLKSLAGTATHPPETPEDVTTADGRTQLTPHEHVCAGAGHRCSFSLHLPSGAQG